MLPHALSSEACSLMPGVPRSAVTVEVSIGAGGRPRSASFYRSLIRSDARLEYGQVDRIFEGREQAPDVIAEPLSLARALAAELREARLARGALGVESSEPDFEFDDEGNVVAARDEIQTEAHWVIEHLMILANEQVAQRLESASVPAMYRVHEQPDPAAIERLVAQLESLDVPTPPVPKAMSPTDAARLVGEISARVLEYQRATGRGGKVLTSLVLRSLKQAYYSTRNIGHAGLASRSYCHFTSPIRRYPDLVVHRALLATIGARGGGAVRRAGGDRGLVQRDRARGGRPRARGRRRVLRFPRRARPGRAWLGAGVRGRGDRRDRGRCVRVLRPRCRRRDLRGTAPGAAHEGRLV